MMSVPVAATAMSFRSRASGEFKTVLSNDDFVGDRDRVTREPVDGFLGACDRIDGAVPLVRESFERDVAVGGGVEKDNARAVQDSC